VGGDGLDGLDVGGADVQLSRYSRGDWPGLKKTQGSSSNERS